ncbi:MAG: Regulator of sigma-E protease RseP [Opitutia bacterium UBA7350]|nr:MAG: Regulator of sigma-E protease RseP [Opitutae bacterium UBA7350]
MNLILNFWFILIAVFVLGFSIFIHELGHFIAARKRGLIADRFSIGFGPRLFGWHYKGTDFRVSLLPLGGYVSLPQLADMGRVEGAQDGSSEPLPPISYADKMIVSVMGVVFNCLLALLISLILWGVGREVINSTEVGHVAQQIVNSENQIVPGPAFTAGLQTGDTITEIDGQKIHDWMQFQSALVTGTGRTDDGRPMLQLGILRDNNPLELKIYPALVSRESIRYIGIEPASDDGAAPIITLLEENMPALGAGLKVGDRLMELDGEAIISGGFLKTYLSRHGDRSIDVTVDRNGQRLTLPVQPRIKTENNETTARFGFAYSFPYKTERIHYSPIAQIKRFVATIGRTFYALVNRDSDVKMRNMSGPVGIVHGLTHMARSGLMEILWFTAFININLGLINLLPVPVLDGGHMLFATISKIIGRPLPRRFIESLQAAFVMLLLGFMLYVSFFDLERVGLDTGLIKDPEPVAAEPAHLAQP